MNQAKANAQTPQRPRALFLIVVIAIMGGCLWLALRVGPSKASPAQDPMPPARQDASAQPASSPMPQPAPKTPAEDPLMQKLGIQVTGVHLSVGGTRLDLRYRVVDPNRAVQLTNRVYGAYLLDSAGRPIRLPGGSVAPPIREQSGQLLRAGYVYSHFFPNPEKVIAQGDKVSLVVGNVRTEPFLVQ